MSEPVNGKKKKFTPLVLKPRRSIRVHYTPNKDRDYHTVSYYDEFGQRQRRAYPDRPTAEAEAAKLRSKINNGVTPGLLVNGRERLIYERALETARTTGLDLDILTKDAAEARAILGTASLTDAARFYAEHRTKVVQKTVAEVVAELVDDRVKNGKSSAYVRDLRTRLGNFANAFRCPMSSVEWKDIESYLNTTGATGRYRKNLIDSFGTLFNFARHRSYVHQNHPGISPITKPAIRQVPYEYDEQGAHTYKLNRRFVRGNHKFGKGSILWEPERHLEWRQAHADNEAEYRRRCKIREFATSLGLNLQKCPQRHPDAEGYGTYQIVDIGLRAIVAAGESGHYGLTLRQCENFLKKKQSVFTPHP